MGNKLSVVLRFIEGPALVPKDVMGRKLSGQIEEEPLHLRTTRRLVRCS
jgi:hypothetical protein